jgi:hypothetical protein
VQPKDVLTLTISLLALAVSLWSATRGWQFNLANIRRTARAGYMTALLDIDKQLIANPQLWQVYGVDVPPLPQPAVVPEHEAGRRLAFIWYHFNLYELVFSEFHASRVMALDRDERLFWDSWDGYIRSFLIKSAEARALVASDDSMKLLNRDFVEYMRGCARSVTI